jgi:hypothetical protein
MEEREFPMITWQVGDGPLHTIPEGAIVTFILEDKEYSYKFEDGGVNSMVKVV